MIWGEEHPGGVDVFFFRSGNSFLELKRISVHTGGTGLEKRSENLSFSSELIFCLVHTESSAQQKRPGIMRVL